MSMHPKQLSDYEDMVYDVRLKLENFVSKEWGQNTADTVEEYLTELSEAIIKANHD